MKNGYHLLIESGPQGYFFCQKWYIKGKGLNLGADPPCIKIYQVTAHQNSPPPPHPKPRWGSQIKSQERSNSPLAHPILHLVCPAKFCIGIVFDFSWDHWNTQEKNETQRLMQNILGQTRCTMADVQIWNWTFWGCLLSWTHLTVLSEIAGIHRERRSR